MFETPILFLIFNRPDTTAKVFSRIRELQPKYLFIAADGPRKKKIGEENLCKESQSIINKIDWDCNVKTLFRDENLGCAKSVGEAITWFFKHVENGIILEDDCFPDYTFFTFCQELLLKYKDNKKIGAICGFNDQLGISRTANKKDSYYFARLHSSWGWATWADRWQKYNEVGDIPDPAILNHPTIVGLKDEITGMFSGKIDSWAYRWQYAFRKNDFLCIYPCIGLITNIGFAENASNTKTNRWWYKFIKNGEIKTIYHPSSIIVSDDADKLTIQLNVSLPLSWKDRLKRKWLAFTK